jgi:myo-inositol-1(or 4)-monophosphatase
MSINYKDLCLSTVEIARLTGRFIREARESHAPESENKGKNDFVTKFDKEAEARIVNALSELLPDAGYIAEENTSDKKGETFNWIIDPIDGTTNFIHGLYPYCISIALMENDEIVIGVIYEPGLDECFYTWKNGPAMLNDKPITVSSRKTVADSLIATGFPYTNFSLMEPFIESLHFFMKNSHGMRRLGSAAADLAYVACGRFEAFYEYDLKPWDVAAGVLLVKQAGGRISDFSGGDNYLFGREIIATNNHVFNEFSHQVADFLKK